MKFKYLPHTADAKFQAFGKTFEEVFLNSASAMMNLITNVKKIAAKSSKKINIKNEKIELLLIDFLNELLFLLETKNFVPAAKGHKIKIKESRGVFNLEGTLKGDNINNYEHHGHIKSATYNELFLKKIKNLYKSQIVIDI